MLRVILLLSIIFLSTHSAIGQCTDVDAGPDQSMCFIPSTFDLEGTITGDILDNSQN